MRIEIQRASNLGVLHASLGIAPDARVSVSRNGDTLEIWDLMTGNYFTTSLSLPSTIKRSNVAIPEWVRQLIAKPTDELLHEWSANWEDGADERRMAIHTELNFRGLETPFGNQPVSS